MRITKKCLGRKFNKELGYNLRDSALNLILESLSDLNLSIDDIDIYGTGSCISVRYYGYYHICNLYEGVHY